MINCFKIEEITSKKEKIDEKLNPPKIDNIEHSNNYEETHNNNYYQEQDCDKNTEKEFEKSYENYEFYLIPYFLIIIIMLSWNLTIIIFRCISIEEGIQCTVTCCIYCGKNLPSCVKSITNFAMLNPLLFQCILEGIFFIVSCVNLKDSKKNKIKITFIL